MLYDRNLRELAMTVQLDSIYADPNEIADKAGAARLWRQLWILIAKMPDSEEQIEARLVKGQQLCVDWRGG